MVAMAPIATGAFQIAAWVSLLPLCAVLVIDGGRQLKAGKLTWADLGWQLLGALLWTYLLITVHYWIATGTFHIITLRSLGLG